MSALSEFEDSWGFIGDIPMVGERIVPRCRVCGRRVRSKRELYHGVCSCRDQPLTKKNAIVAHVRLVGGLNES